MKNTQVTEDNTWYTNRIVWMLIAIPGLTIAGCLLTIYLAISHPETLVHDAVPDESQSTSIPREARP
jgi:hypothetical protein